MASSEGLLISPSAATEAEGEEPATPRARQWKVELARFFNFPRSAPPAGLRSLPKIKRCSNGTWISSKSLATLLVHKPNLHSAPLLSLTVPALACEEHCVSNLNFSWPQVSCVPQCPVRSSRVVFASYMDSFIQLQKFAMRFSTCSDAESFLDFVKEMVDDAPHECEISSQSEVVSSAGLNSSIEEPTPMNDGGIRGSDDNKEPELSQHSMLFSSAPSISSELPHSFTEFLTNCLSGTEKVIDQTVRIGEPDPGSHAQEHLVNPLLQAAPEQLESMEVGDITTSIECMSDATFHDILSELEKAIYESGGDLALEVTDPSLDDPGSFSSKGQIK
ncbi:protein POOR HOMOLOGOUS SYNAPSIS 1-like [Curcuma longa]|uniref:protein POOR HOMOLOGOUS SYNAPSIS 1-like n=1 Tax=Curcuma longa TaxID=136217 RepID=UPI003D9E2E83